MNDATPQDPAHRSEAYAAECVEKLSEKSRRHPKLGLRRHPKGTVRPVLVPEQRPNPRSEHCSYPFSESFGRGILRSSSPEIASWYIRSTPPGICFTCCIRREGGLITFPPPPYYMRKEEEDGPNSRAGH